MSEMTPEDQYIEELIRQHTEPLKDEIARLKKRVEFIERTRSEPDLR